MEFSMQLDLSGILLGLIGLVYILLIPLTFRTRHAKNQGLGFYAAFVIFLLAVTIFQLLQRFNTPLSLIRADIAARFPLYTAFILSVFLFQTTFTFLQKKFLPWVWWLAAAFILGIGILISENINGLVPEQVMLGATILHRDLAGQLLLTAAWVFFSTAAFLTTLVTRQRSVHPLHRNRYILWLVGLSFCILGNYLSTEILLSVPVGEIVILLAVVMLGYSLFTHNLPDIKHILKNSLSLVISILLSILVYTVFLIFFQSVFYHFETTLQGFIQAVFIAAVFALLINPILGKVQKVVNNLILKSNQDAEHIISDYTKSISNIIDLSRLAEVVTGTIVRGLNIHQARLFLVSETDDNMVLSAVETQAGDTLSTAVSISTNSPLADYWRYEHRPLAQYDLDLLPYFRSMTEAESTALKSLSIDLYVPISIQNRLIGILGLGAKKSRDRYFVKELALLETLAEQTAISLENARLYEDLKLRSAENETLNRELTSANRDLSRLDKAKSDFLNIASHELRTPLTQIIGYNDIVENMASTNELTPTNSMQMTEGVRKAALRLEEIVNTMFDVSRLDIGSLELSMAPVSVLMLVNGAAAKWKDALENRNLTMIISPELKDLPRINADGKRMIQVFSHLIQNAIKFTPDGGQVWVYGQKFIDQQDDKKFVEIIVADSGIGIDPEELEYIFEKFYRLGDVMLHSTGETKFKGAGPGLGLTICRGIIEAHGGRVWAESSGYDEEWFPGSKFHVLIPISL
jgi:signal transduction histidine kinase